MTDGSLGALQSLPRTFAEARRAATTFADPVAEGLHLTALSLFLGTLPPDLVRRRWSLVLACLGLMTPAELAAAWSVSANNVRRLARSAMAAGVLACTNTNQPAATAAATETETS